MPITQIESCRNFIFKRHFPIQKIFEPRGSPKSGHRGHRSRCRATTRKAGHRGERRLWRGVTLADYCEALLWKSTATPSYTPTTIPAVLSPSWAAPSARLQNEVDQETSNMFG